QLRPPRIIDSNTTWVKAGTTIAGLLPSGPGVQQLDRPYGIYIDNTDQSIYIADYGNHRIVRWKTGATSGVIVAGNNDFRNQMEQLHNPTDVLLDKDKNFLIICDSAYQRVVRCNG
ncbi:unnamed protein product, partial [Adineta ricciae]